MQASLFRESPPVTGESIEAINEELFEKGRTLFPDKVFVFGAGNAKADIIVIGESPGPPDIALKKPFNGPAGDLLRKILGSVGIKADDCWLTNAAKFVSQGDEITNEVMTFFTPYLRREILAINPQLVICLGNTPAKALLNKKEAISKIRGEFHEFEGIQVMPTFNPAYLLRDPTKKREVWDDMKKVRDFISG